MPADPNRAESLFHRALELSPAARAAFLTAECSGDAELRGRVERLLAEHERQQSFVLDTPPAGLDATTFRPISEQPGATCDKGHAAGQVEFPE